MRKKWIALALCALLCLAPFCALGGARLPERRGAVTDDADVLGTQTVADITEFAERLEKETNVRLQVAIVHFLDGLDAQTYADTLFERWELDKRDMLLLCAAGEDSFATAMSGELLQTIGRANAENLMFTSSEFAALVRSQQYDQAFAAYCKALGTLAGKQLNGSVSMNGLFGQTEAQPPKTTQYGSELWNEVMAAISESSVDYQESHAERKREEEGMTAGSWLVLLILIFIVFRQDKTQKRRRKERRFGCLGWLLGLLGVNALADLLRKRH